jgi:hypothetical protein
LGLSLGPRTSNPAPRGSVGPKAGFLDPSQTAANEPPPHSCCLIGWHRRCYASPQTRRGSSC